MEVKVLWDRYVAANARSSEIDGQKQAKVETKVRTNTTDDFILLESYFHSQFLNFRWYSLLLFASQIGILKRMEDKENERDLAELELSKLNLSHIDEREKNLVITLSISLE